MRRQQTLLCAAVLLLCGAHTAAGRLQAAGADADPLRNAVYNNLKVSTRDRKHLRVARTYDTAPDNADSSGPDSSLPAEPLAADVPIVRVVATTLKGLRCKPMECTYDTTQITKTRVRAGSTWSVAAVNAGVFTQGVAGHYLQLVKLCHTMKGAFDAASVGVAYEPDAGKVHLSLRFPDASATTLDQFADHSSAVNRRISALLAESLVTRAAPILINQVTVQQPLQAAV